MKQERLRKRKHDYSATRVGGMKHLDQYCASVPTDLITEQAVLGLGIIYSICFFQVNVPFIKISRNFLLVIGMICMLWYVMLISEIDLPLAVNCINVFY